MTNQYSENTQRRRSFHIDGYKTLADVGMDGDYVSPLQITSRSAMGPVLVAYNWFDAPSAIVHRDTLQRFGYMPGIPFNRVLDNALAIAGLNRADLYMTQAFHLLPSQRSERIPFRDVEASFDSITRHELYDRRVIALGSDAARACRKFGIKFAEVPHPSARIGSFNHKAQLIARALM